MRAGRGRKGTGTAAAGVQGPGRPQDLGAERGAAERGAAHAGLSVPPSSRRFGLRAGRDSG